MSFLIGGLSPQQYRAYLLLPSEQKPKGNSAFKFASYHTLSVFINRLAYFINRLAYFFLHRLSVYPDNAYLFRKFKAHQFTAISTEADYEVAREIFKSFKQCTNLNQNSLTEVKTQLKEAKKKAEEKKKVQTKVSRVERKQKDRALKEAKKIKAAQRKKAREEELEAKKAESEQNALSLTPPSTPPSEEEGKNSNQPDLNLEDKTELRLRPLFDELSQSQIERQQRLEEVPPIPLPQEIERIVSQLFLLDESKSIQDLFQKGAEQLLVRYRQELKILLRFENKLHIEKLKLADSRFTDYLKQMQDAFDRAWLKACEKCAELREDFQEKFTTPNLSPQLMENGEVICTASQVDWVISTIKEHFPAIYQLAFDAPSLDIYQSRQVATLAQLILVGPEAQEKHISSPCFIRIGSTVGKTTPVIEKGAKNNPLLKAGSYIYTHFVGPSGVLKEGQEIHKKQLGELISLYVKDWLNRPGVSLQLRDTDGGIMTIRGGQTTEKFKASDWVSYVRQIYMQTLLNMDEKALQEEIRSCLDCPLVRLIIKTYAKEIEDQLWTTSQFPASLMEKLFQEELKKARQEPQLHQALLQTIEDTHFNREGIIKALAERAKCSVDRIEPLLRIRVLYIICCLGQATIEPVVRGINQRAKTMCNPAVGDELSESSLSCQFTERLLSFGPHFDQMEINVQANFRNLNKVHAVAQASSKLHVRSLNDSKKRGENGTTLIDIQELRFSLYSSRAQRRYLVAQITPENLIANLRRLVVEIGQLELVKKAERYQQTKHNDKKSLWPWQISVFDKKRYLTLDQDSQHLKEAIRQAEMWVTYWNTQQILCHCKQLSDGQMSIFQQSKETILSHLNQMLAMLKELYECGDSMDAQRNVLSDQIKKLTGLIEIKADQVGVSLNPEEQASLEAESLSNVSEEERGLQPNSEDAEDTIGKTVEADTTIGVLVNGVVNYMIGESNEVKNLKWKIERYEDLILGVQKSAVAYLESKGLGNIPQLIAQAEQESAPVWMRQILAILILSQKSLRHDSQRLNLTYLREVRKCYTQDFLGQLRLAAQWAKEHPYMPGVEHVDALCYQLYTSLDLNHRCQEVLKTFVSLGEEALKKRPILHSHTLSADDLYDMVRDLYTAHQQIKAVPNAAKAPLFNQWANSARGYLNGVWQITSFDPNMQSNPIHVFFNRVITTKEEGSQTLLTRLVKDIAMGSPTIERGSGKVEINPEFQGTLRHYSRIGHSHLYVNNQNFIPKGVLEGDESARCQALHDLAEHEFKETLVVITLSQNSVFYEQKGHQLSGLDVNKIKDAIISQLLRGTSKGMRHYLPADLIGQPVLHTWMAQEIDRIHKEEFANCTYFANEKIREQFVQRYHICLREHVQTLLATFSASNGQGLGYSIYDDSAVRFKDELIAQLFERPSYETGNFIPVDLVKRFSLNPWSKTTADTIHQKMFGDRQQLTLQERRIFTRLFYHNLTRKILIETKVNSSNTSCKDRIDRGAATDAEDVAYLAILENRMNDPKLIEFFKMMVFSRAIIVRKRSIIEERLERLIETVKFMLENQKNLLELHTQLFPGIEVTIDQFSSLKEEEHL